MKVLVVGMTPMTGGVESVIMNYFRNIDKSVCQFCFLSEYENIAYQDEILHNGGEILKVVPRRRSLLKHKKSLAQIFQNSKYDAIWVNLCTLSNISYLKIAKKYNIRTRIIHSHNSENMGSKLTLMLHKFNRNFIAKYATDFWACSDVAGKFFYNSKIIQSDKYKVIKNAIDLEKFKFNQDIRLKYRKELNIEDKFVVGHVGRFHFQKNHTFLINVFYELQKKKPNAVLLLVGQGEDEEKLKQQVSDLKLNDKVKFLGIRKDVNNLLFAFDLVIFPSLFEGLSVALLEAQATGLPIFASDTISAETKVNDNFKFLSLNSSANEWVDSILNNLNLEYRNNNAIKNLNDSGFNIKNQVENFVKLIKTQN